jgi:hypothetical protein
MIATVEGTFNEDGTSGTATRVALQSEVKGPIQAVACDAPLPADAKNASLTVLGQTVEINRGETVIDGGTGDPTFGFEDLVADGSQIVEVSGLLGPGGTIQATRIELQGADGSVELRGIISNYDALASTFQLASAEISFDVSTTLDGLTFEELANGLLVQVKGSFDEDIVSATEIELEDEFDEDIDEVELEGIIGECSQNAELFCLTTQDITIGRQIVRVENAVFSPASLEQTLKQGMRVEVEGPIQAGVLQAEEVKIRSRDIRLIAELDAKTSNRMRFFVPAEESEDSAGISVRFDAATRCDDDVNQNLTSCQEIFDDLSVGDYLEIRGFEDGAGEIMATLLERSDDNGPDEIRLRGTAQDSEEAQTFTLLGVRIRTDGNTDFEGASGNSIAENEFFQTLGENSGIEVKVRWKSLNWDDVPADDVEIED